MRALSRAIVLVVGVAWCVVVGPARADAPTTGPAVPVGGAWKGVFCQDATVFLADLTLDDAGVGGGAITGELHFTSVLAPLGVARTARPVEGGWRVTAVVDAGSRTVTISPQAGARPAQPVSPMQMQAMQPQVMAAVYVASSEELAGQFQPKFARQDIEPNYFLFARAQKAEAIQRLADRAAAVALPMRSARPVRGAPAQAVTAPGPDELKAWAKRYEEEYPGRGPSDPTNKTAMQAMPLLNDATFKPVFGAPYDAVDVQVLMQSIQRARGMPERGPNGIPIGRQDFDFARQYGYLEYVLRPTAPRMVAVAAMRAIDAWEAEQVERFQKGAASAGTFDELAAAQKAIHERVVYAWPSDRKKTDELFEQIRSSHAGEGLMASVDRAVGEAKQMAGAQALAGWAKANASALQHASAAEREAATAKVNARLDALLAEALEPEVAKLATLGVAIGGDALGAGVAWYRDVTKRFAFASGRPPVIEAIAKLTKRRPQDMIDARPAMLAAIARSQSPNEIDILFDRELSVPGDQAAPGYAVLAEAGRQRKADIEKEKILARYSERERAMMDPNRPGHLLLSKMDPNVAPTAEEVRLAELRGWAFGSGQMIDAHTARHVSMLNPPVPVPFPFPINIKITDERLVEPMPKRLPDSDLWEVHFKMRMTIEFPKDNPLANYDRETRKGYDMMAQMTNKALEAADDTYTRQLRLYEDGGWGVPELRAAGAVDGVLGQMMKVQR